MNHQEIITKIKPELEKAVSFLERELTQIRTGRASPSLVENIVADCFGQKFPLKQLATITLSGPRQLVIQPWDKSYIEGISKAIESSNLKVSAIVERDIIKVNIPPLSEEYRKDLIKLLSEKSEDIRKQIRHFRDKAWDEVQEKTRTGEIREDDKFKAKDKLQEMVDEYREKIDGMVERKKKEIME